MIKLGVRSERTKGVLAMTDEEFRAELQKPVAVIRIGMDEFRRQGQSARFSIGMGRVPAGDGAIEREIQAKGLTAPRVTPADIEACIVGEHYFTAGEGVHGREINENGQAKKTEATSLSEGVERLLDARIPILDQLTELCYAIEKCGASPELTDAVTKASALREPISKLVQQALTIGVGAGIVSVDVSPKLPACTCGPKDGCTNC